MVRRLASIFAILLLLSTAAPLMACMTDAAMDQQQSACCRSMHGDCGEMAKMGCCATKVHSDERPQFAATAPVVVVHVVIVDWIPTSRSEPRTTAPSLPRAPDAHSPPGLRIARTTVLRI